MERVLHWCTYEGGEGTAHVYMCVVGRVLRMCEVGRVLTCGGESTAHVYVWVLPYTVCKLFTESMLPLCSL